MRVIVIYMQCNENSVMLNILLYTGFWQMSIHWIWQQDITTCAVWCSLFHTSYYHHIFLGSVLLCPMSCLTMNIEFVIALLVSLQNAINDYRRSASSLLFTKSQVLDVYYIEKRLKKHNFKLQMISDGCFLCILYVVISPSAYILHSDILYRFDMYHCNYSASPEWPKCIHPIDILAEYTRTYNKIRCVCKSSTLDIFGTKKSWIVIYK